MGNAGSRWVEIDAVLARERLDLRILRQIFGRSILDVVIDGEHWLCRIGNRCRADLFEFRNHRAGVVMRHHMARANRNEIAAVPVFPEQVRPHGAPQSFNKCKAHITLGLPRLTQKRTLPALANVILIPQWREKNLSLL